LKLSSHTCSTGSCEQVVVQGIANANKRTAAVVFAVIFISGLNIQKLNCPIFRTESMAIVRQKILLLNASTLIPGQKLHKSGDVQQADGPVMVHIGFLLKLAICNQVDERCDIEQSD
jgi:hypothetical protein